MEYLILAQTVFYAVFSFAVFVLSILLAVVIYYLIGITKHLRKITGNMDEVSEEIREKIREIVEALENLPILSFLFRKGGRKEAPRKHKRS